MLCTVPDDSAPSTPTAPPPRTITPPSVISPSSTSECRLHLKPIRMFATRQSEQEVRNNTGLSDDKMKCLFANAFLEY